MANIKQTIFHDFLLKFQQSMFYTLFFVSLTVTANICSGSTGFHCGTNPTAVSLHFLQTNNANIECKNCKTIFTVGCL